MKQTALILLFGLLFTVAYPQCADTANIFKFTHKGKTYEIVKEMKTWSDAASCAVERGGYLVEINDQDEQDAVFDAIINGAGVSPTYTIVNDGGGIAYVWIGATDQDTEGTWLWDGNNDGLGVNFWNGEGAAGANNGAPVGNSFYNWGGKSTGIVKEPDNTASFQHYAAIALDGWPAGTTALGIAGEWNDIFGIRQLYYVIEYDPIGIGLKVFLQSPYLSGSMMRTDLKGNITTRQPYNSPPWNYHGNEMLNSVPSNMVDWVLVELRDPADPRVVMAQCAAVLLNDGTVVDTALNSSIIFSGISPGNYFVCIHHRNHFPVMSANPLQVPSSEIYDFSDTLNFPPFGGGSNALIETEQGVLCMIAGDVNRDGAIKYSGPANDRAPILQHIVNQSGSSNITTTVSGYRDEDVNMDSIIKYSGPSNDPSIIIQNLVGLTGSSSITEVYYSVVPKSIIKKECGYDTVELKVNNYQYGTVQWEQSYDTLSWIPVEGANDTIFRFLPTETKYYRAVIKFSAAPPEYTEHTIVQIAPNAKAGTDRVVAGNSVVMMGNVEPKATGVWSVIEGSGGAFSDINDPYSEFQGNDSLYMLCWTLSNTCGVSSDTVRIEFIQNVYRDVCVIVDSTDMILSDSAQMSQGVYVIRFSNPVPAITDSTVLLGLVNDGFIRVVDSFSYQGDTVTMYTQQGTLEDFTIQGAYDLTQILDIDTTLQRSEGFERMNSFPTRKEMSNPKYQTGNYYYMAGSEPVYTYPGADATLGKNRNGSSLINLNLDCNLVKNNNLSVSLRGTYKSRPNIVSDLKINNSEIEYMRTGMYNGTFERDFLVEICSYDSTNSINGNIQQDATLSSSIWDFPFSLLSYETDIIFVFGGIPIWIRVKIDIDGTISVDMPLWKSKTNQFTKNSSYIAAIEYENNQWRYPFYERNEVNTESDSIVCMNITQLLDIGQKIIFEVYGDIAPYTDDRTTHDFTQRSDNTNWDANLNISGKLTVGARTTALGENLPEVTKTFSDGNYNIRTPYHLEIISGNNQRYNSGNALLDPVKVQVKSNQGYPVPDVPVRFQPKSGGSVGTITVFSDIYGEALTFWTPGGVTASELEVNVNDGDGNPISNAPLLLNAHEHSGPTDCSQSSLSASIEWIGNNIAPAGKMGSPPYTYSTDGVNYSSVQPSLTTTFPMNITFYVKDAMGCIATVSYSLPPDICSFSRLEIDVLVTDNTIEALPITGKPPHVYALDDTIFGYSTDNVFKNVNPGTHRVFVKDDNNCVTSKIVEVYAVSPVACPPSFTDPRDNNVYPAVMIGDQCWMAENLAYLPSVSPSGTGSKTVTHYYVYGYNGSDVGAAKSTVNYQAYGVLYNWPAAMGGQASTNNVPSGVQGVCPAGWHLPSDEEWKILEGEVDSQYGYPDPEWNKFGWRGYDVAGSLKETGTVHWNSPNSGATNSSGFTALAGGRRTDYGSFTALKSHAFFWTTLQDDNSTAWLRNIYYNYYTNYNVNRFTDSKDEGFSVRCVKD